MLIKGKFIPKRLCLFAEGDPPNPPGGGTPPPDASADLRRRLAENEGSNAVVAQQLANENYQLRVKEGQQAQAIAGLNTQIADLKKQIPAEGVRVLTADEAKVFDALVAIGKPEEIKVKLEKLPDLESKVAAQEKATTLRKAAQSEGYDEDVFSSIAGDWEFEFKTVEDKGQKREAAFVKVKDGDAFKSVPLAEHVEATQAKFLPSLKAQTTTPTTKHVKQDATGKPPSANKWDAIREKAKKDHEAKKVTAIPLEKRMNLITTH